MKAKDVLKVMGITRSHLSRLVKLGKISVTKQTNLCCVYSVSDVYDYVGKKRRNLSLNIYF